VAITLIAGAAPAKAGQGPANDARPLVGIPATFSPTQGPTFQLRAVMARYRAARAEPGNRAVWEHLVEQLKPLDLRAKLQRVNGMMNSYPYVLSVRNWGRPDYWETPFELMRAGGQCQDFALAKYLLLRASGVADDLMRLVFVRDARDDLGHAILVVDVSGELLVLDNQSAGILSADRIDYYRPNYAMNQSGWWHYGE